MISQNRDSGLDPAESVAAAPESGRMKMHPEIATQSPIAPDIISVAEIIHQHHERYDGSGYPRGLRGEQICLAPVFSRA
jgi:response regulator RpfG family c-di-GMP phosphodiesterase